MEKVYYKKGQGGCLERKITEEDIIKFAEVTGDFNSVHINKEKAEKTVFGKQIAHGMMTASLISAVLGTVFPGEGTIYLGQKMNFKKPVYIGDTITARVEIIEVKQNGKARLMTNVFNQNGECVIDGEAEVKLP